jgi:hypothetical protein
VDFGIALLRNLPLYSLPEYGVAFYAHEGLYVFGCLDGRSAAAIFQINPCIEDDRVEECQSLGLEVRSRFDVKAHNMFSGNENKCVGKISDFVHWLPPRVAALQPVRASSLGR